MAVKDWSTTASSNTSVGGVSIAELCPRANLNNAQRAMMAEMKTWINDRPLTHIKDVLDVTIDGATDQTSTLTAYLATLTGSRLNLYLPPQLKYEPDTVMAAVPTGVTLVMDDDCNWGQPPGYSNRFRITYRGDTVSNDRQEIISSGHHPALMLLNMGTAGSGAASSRYASILHGVGRDPNGDPLLGFMYQMAKDPSSSAWRVSLRLQTPYAVATTLQAWAATTAFGLNEHCVTTAGRVYKATVAGTTSSTEPTHTSSTATDGSVTWEYVQGAINIDSTRWDLNESGAMGLYGSAVSAFTMQGGSRQLKISVDDATDDVAFQDISRGLDIFRTTSTSGLQFGFAQSFKWLNVSGATPTAPATGAGYVNNGTATTMTAMTAPNSQTNATVTLFFANGNTTIEHGANFVLKGAVNATPAANTFITLVRYGTHSSAWIEFHRSY